MAAIFDLITLIPPWGSEIHLIMALIWLWWPFWITNLCGSIQIIVSSLSKNVVRLDGWYYCYKPDWNLLWLLKEIHLENGAGKSPPCLVNLARYVNMRSHWAACMYLVRNGDSGCQLSQNLQAVFNSAFSPIKACLLGHIVLID